MAVTVATLLGPEIRVACRRSSARQTHKVEDALLVGDLDFLEARPMIRIPAL